MLKRTLPIAGVLLCAVSCFPGRVREAEPLPGPAFETTEFLPAEYGGALALSKRIILEELAETERSSGLSPGMGLTEAMLRVDAGDYGGAMIASYKELSWMYAYGSGGIRAENIEEGLTTALSTYQNKEGDGPEGELSPESYQRLEIAFLASQGILAFHRGQWAEARRILEGMFNPEDEPDSFAQWMRLVCSLEGEGAPPITRAAYGAIRARYETFPEYWYRGARNFSGPIRNDYAEICINLAPQGPYAEECRRIIAQGVGLPPEDGKDILSRMEIEERVKRSLVSEDPEVLKELCPLLALPDNPYTLYASGALRALAPVEGYREWFAGEAARASGRLAERLLYISKG